MEQARSQLIITMKALPNSANMNKIFYNESIIIISREISTNNINGNSW